MAKSELSHEIWPAILGNVAKSDLVGRSRERATLDAMLASDRAELVALYGRRRIGKTYLVRQHVQPRAGTYLEVTGAKNGSGALQRRRLREALESVFAGGNVLPNSLFYLAWIDGAPKGVLARGGAGRWQSTAQTPSYRAWTGYSFENVCLKHARELERALGIENLVTAVGAWRWAPGRSAKASRGAQIDLLFDRRDGVLNLFEMKFGAEPFVVTKAYARELKEKISVFEQRLKPRKRIVLTLVTPAGLKRNAWSEDLVDRVLDVDALFQ